MKTTGYEIMMNNPIQQYIAGKLEQRKQENNFRSLKVITELTDFYSNDYLGFARDEELKRLVEAEVQSASEYLLGSTGSRLLSGNSAYAESVERFLAEFYGAESALIFNSGFDANYGLLSTLPYRGDTIIYDELVHASIHDGIRNSRADAVGFIHNDINDLEAKLVISPGLKYVVVESVYSMDGDFALLKEIALLCEKYNAGLIVDEAHAVGISGEKGMGVVCDLKLEIKCLARINTFGKALGAHGAVMLCNDDLKAFMVNYCRPFIYSTSLPFHSLATIKCAHRFLLEADDRRTNLFALIDVFQHQFKGQTKYALTAGNSPIQSLIVAGNEQVKQIAQQIQQAGFDVRAILYPTVARGKERIRICIHSFNSKQEVIKLAEVINSL
jgi:8-amino-7-oxononanoate synthase